VGMHLKGMIEHGGGGPKPAGERAPARIAWSE
jgi:hypothetical protein